MCVWNKPTLYWTCNLLQRSFKTCVLHLSHKMTTCLWSYYLMSATHRLFGTKLNSNKMTSQIYSGCWFVSHLIRSSLLLSTLKAVLQIYTYIYYLQKTQCFHLIAARFAFSIWALSLYTVREYWRWYFQNFKNTLRICLRLKLFQDI